MDLIIDFFVAAFSNIARFLGFFTFKIGSVSVSFFDILIGAFVISIIISVFWKGGKG